jgi:hypothetical protein
MQDQRTIIERINLYVTPPSVLCLALIVANSILYSAAHGKDQSSLFQTEAAVIDNMPAKKFKVGDIDMV